LSFSSSAPAGEDILDYTFIEEHGVRTYSKNLLAAGNDFTTDEDLTDRFIANFDALPDDYIFSQFKITFNSLTELTTNEQKQLDTLIKKIQRKLIKKMGADKINSTSFLGPEIIVNPDFSVDETCRFIIDTDTPKVAVSGKYLTDYNNAIIYTKPSAE
jgi:hypothetical protein